MVRDSASLGVEICVFPDHYLIVHLSYYSPWFWHLANYTILSKNLHFRPLSSLDRYLDKMLGKLISNILAIPKEAFAGEIVDNQLNSLHLAVATTGYRIQSRTLQIPDRFGFFPPPGASGFGLYYYGQLDLPESDP